MEVSYHIFDGLTSIFIENSYNKDSNLFRINFLFHIRKQFTTLFFLTLNRFNYTCLRWLTFDLLPPPHGKLRQLHDDDIRDW